jgi:hypothetical protein
MKFSSCFFSLPCWESRRSRVGESVNASDQDETRIFEESKSRNRLQHLTNVTPGGGGGTGGINDKHVCSWWATRTTACFRQGDRNESELITIKTINVLTMTIPSASDILANETPTLSKSTRQAANYDLCNRLRYPVASF